MVLGARSTLLLGAASCALIACGDDGPGALPADAGADAPAESRTVELVFDLSSTARFFDRPFPLDARRLDDGRPDLTGYPNPRRLAIVQSYIDLAQDTVDGFSPTGPIWMRFTGKLDASSLPTDPAATVADDSPFLLVDIDPTSPDRGERTPVIVDFRETAESFRPANLLQVLPVPGFNLREERLYALIVRDTVRSGEVGKPLAQSAGLLAALTGTAPPGELGERVSADFAALRAYLTERGIAPTEVIAATVYRTGDVTSELARLVAFARTTAAPSVDGSLRVIQNMPEYCALGGSFMAPQFQNGTPPFTSSGGALQYGSTGEPAVQRTERVPFVVTVPKRVMPATGFPLVFYVNGTGGNTRQIIDRGTSSGGPPAAGTGPAQLMARRGWAASGVAGVLTAERIGEVAAGGGYVVYNLQNPRALRDNFFQMTIEHVLYRRLLLALRISPSLCDGVDASAAGDGMVQYDASKLVVMGQSLGSYLGGMLAALDDGYKGAILTGAGGSWIEFVFGVRSPHLEPVAGALVGLQPGESLDRFHPMIAAFDLGAGPADNTHYHDNILRRPFAGHTPPHVLVIEGNDDDNIGENLQRALVAAIGVDLVGTDVGPADERIEGAIALAGHSVRAPPVSNNVMTPAGLRTAGVVRYIPDSDDGGHYVTFQLDGPKHQYGCFLESLNATGTPVIVAPAAEAAPCE